MNNNNMNINQDNQFEIFNYQNLGQVRVSTLYTGEPVFCLVDICNILGIKNSSRVMERLLTPGVHTMNLGVQTGVKTDGTPAIQFVDMTFVDQGNLFKIIFTSRKPEAQNFANWVSYEVLPSLMNKGYYAMPNMSPMEMIHSISGELIEQKKTLDEYGNVIAQHTQQINEHTRMIEILEREGYYTISGYAKLKGIPLTLNDARNLGSRATEICIQRNIAVAPVQHDRLNYVHAYPFGILNEVFSNIVLGN